MPAQKSTAASLFTAIAGTLGFSALAGVLVTVMVAPAIAVTGITANNTVGIFNSLPEYIELDSGSQQNTIVVNNPSQDPENPDDDYITVATLYDQNRQEIALDEMNEYVQCAAVAGEDRRFDEHGGVDMPSLIRAAVGQVTGDDGAGGASTLTMQLVRNILQQQAINDETLTEEERKQEIRNALDPTIDRKIKEMKLAIGLEKNYSKDQILAGYLNIAGFGGNTYGVQAAAYEFFGETASTLTAVQAASLIAIVQYPSTRSLNSDDNFAANQERRDVILGFMADYGCITDAEYDEARAIPVDADFVNRQPSVVGCRNATPIIYGFVCDYAKRTVTSLTALGATEDERSAAWKRGGYQLVLTIDPRLQQAAYDNVLAWAPADETRFDLGAVATSVQVGTGNIVAMAQNKYFDDSPDAAEDVTKDAVNYAVDRDHGGSIGFQPGSTYKPYVLLAFLAAGHGVNESYNAGVREVNQAEFADSCAPESVGSNVVGPPWGGKYDFKNDSNEQGSYTIVRGTAASVNSVFIQMAKAVDQCDIKKLAESIGVHNGNPDQELITRPSCSIGGCENAIAPLQQAAAYAAIANSGVFCEPRMVGSVIIEETGEVLEGEPVKCGQSLVSPEVANTAAYAMEAVMRGTGSASNPNDGTPYIGKTGTTDKSIHTWMVGSSRSVATAVWVGNVQGDQAMRNIRINGTSGGLLRHRIFKPLAQAIDAIYPGGGFPGPAPELLTGSPVEVPNLVGTTLEQANAALTLAELGFEDGGQVDSDLPAGQVASTEPAAGASVSRGTTVRVFTSNGLAQPVPNVVGMSPSAADSALQAEGFDVATVCYDPSDVAEYPTTPPPDNTVMSQDPPAGAMRNPANTTVTITYYRTTPGSC
ncbi:transglycosylase domain-containing protein [Pseudolysinimonas sp.]|jgi:membrane peptidoglycan carboxypeptidase|uniref:transglycosylase domain-containing protein n=1 Tax=Pseudolysinimonas sp. TaxID=2680009 RepID=UPI003784D1A5